jgi:hypothetical protein
MKRLKVHSAGGGLAALIVSQILAAPSVAHTADQYLDTVYVMTGESVVSQSLAGNDLPRSLTPPHEVPVWRYLNREPWEFAQIDERARRAPVVQSERDR